MDDEETVTQPGVWVVKGNKDGSLLFTIPSDRSEEWRLEFEKRWNEERKRKDSTIEPLGEVIVNRAKGSVGITITSSVLGSDEWQVGTARKLIGILDRDLNEPKDES
jgi:hypothetical protein